MDKKVDGPIEAFGPLFRLLLTLFIGGIGLLICGQLGALAMPTPPGIGSLLFGVLGGLLFGLVGCCVSGFWKDLLPQEDMHTMLNRQQRKWTGHDASDQLICTVQKVTNVSVAGRFYSAAENYFTPEFGSTLSRPELFVELECAHNPSKVTCVKKDGIFNEQFILQIQPGERELLITVKDQNVYGSTPVGFVSLNVDEDIMRQGLPLNIKKPLQAGPSFSLRHPIRFLGGHESAEIWLNFASAIDHAENVAVHEKVADLHGKHIDPEMAVLKEGETPTPRGNFTGHYGAVEFLTANAFDKVSDSVYDGNSKAARKSAAP